MAFSMTGKSWLDKRPKRECWDKQGEIGELEAEVKRLKGIIYDIGKITIHHKVANKTPIQCLEAIRYLAKQALNRKDT